MIRTPAPTTPWVTPGRRSPQERLTLFCFPYAGGSASIYRNWAAKLPAFVNVCPVQLPGRGPRTKEPSYTNLEAMVADLAKNSLPLMEQPFAFFGHSMGALISFELARTLKREHGLAPVHLFLSGRRAPQVPDTEPLTYNLPDAEFIEELRHLKGTPSEVLEHPELMQLLLPLLRTDFEVCQTYQYVPGELLDCPMSVFGGLEDDGVLREHLEPWKELTSGPFILRMLPGDHFFLHSSEAVLLHVLARQFAQLVDHLP